MREADHGICTQSKAFLLSPSHTPLRALLLLRCLSRIDELTRISRTLLVVIAVAITQSKSQMFTRILLTFFNSLDSAHVHVASPSLTHHDRHSRHADPTA
jgi:hypothetical protein